MTRRKVSSQPRRGARMSAACTSVDLRRGQQRSSRPLILDWTSRSSGRACMRRREGGWSRSPCRPGSCRPCSTAPRRPISPYDARARAVAANEEEPQWARAAPLTVITGDRKTRERRAGRRRALDQNEQITCWRCENDTGIATSMAVRVILAPRRTPLQHKRGPSSRVFQSERGGPMTLAAHSMPGTIVCR